MIENNIVCACVRVRALMKLQRTSLLLRVGARPDSLLRRADSTNSLDSQKILTIFSTMYDTTRVVCKAL